MDSTLGDLVALEFKIGALRKQLLDNLVVAGQDTAQELDDIWTPLKAAIDSCTQVVGDDFTANLT